jgi:hypothetical protein
MKSNEQVVCNITIVTILWVIISPLIYMSRYAYTILFIA